MSMTTSSGPPKLPWNKHAGLQGERHPHKTSASNGRLRPWGRPARGRAGVAPSSDCDGCCIPAPCCHEMLSTQFGLSAGKNAKKKIGSPGRPGDPRADPGTPGTTAKISQILLYRSSPGPAPAKFTRENFTVVPGPRGGNRVEFPMCHVVAAFGF